MRRKLTDRQLTLTLLAAWNDLSHKEIGARAGIARGRVASYMGRSRKTELDDDIYSLLLRAVTRRRGEESVVQGSLEAMAALGQESDLSEEELAAIEEEVLEAARLHRKFLTAVALRSRTEQPEEGYPHAFELPFCRQQAEEQIAELRRLPGRARLAVVRLTPAYQTWALCERCCDESIREASRNLKRAAAWARLALAIARLMQGPQGWRNAVLAYAFLEGSLRRDQRRFEEALFAFDQARAVSRRPERVLIKKATVYDVMGEYERAVIILLEAGPGVERLGDPRLLYLQRFNLAVAATHLGRYAQASELIEQVRTLATRLEDEIFLIRVAWLDGRILAGLGRSVEARRLLAEARSAPGTTRACGSSHEPCGQPLGSPRHPASGCGAGTQRPSGSPMHPSSEVSVAPQAEESRCQSGSSRPGPRPEVSRDAVMAASSAWRMGRISGTAPARASLTRAGRARPL